MRDLRACLVLAAFFAFTFPLMPLQLLFLWTGCSYARTFPHWYHRQVCKIIGVRLHIDGSVARERGVLLISNHVSWLDITVLSAVAPVSFVAKQEVASWPFVSWLAKLQRSVFIDRNRRTEVTGKANEILVEASGRRPYRAVCGRNLERREQRVAVQDAALCCRQAIGRKAARQPASAPRPWPSPIPSCMASRFAAAGGRSLPGMATWIWPAMPGGCWAWDPSTLTSELARQFRSTASPTARRSPAMPRSACARTWPISSAVNIVELGQARRGFGGGVSGRKAARRPIAGRNAQT